MQIKTGRRKLGFDVCVCGWNWLRMSLVESYLLVPFFYGVIDALFVYLIKISFLYFRPVILLVNWQTELRFFMCLSKLRVRCWQVTADVV